MLFSRYVIGMFLQHDKEDVFTVSVITICYDVLLSNAPGAGFI